MLLLLTLLGCGSPVPPTPETSTTSTDMTWPDQGMLLDNVHLLDTEGARTDRAILVEGTQIVAILDSRVTVPAGIEVVDLEGAWLIPGLVDAHVHLTHSGALGWVGSTVEDNLRAQLGWGVVGVGDMGSPTWIFGLRDRISSGEVLGPRVFATGPFLTAEGSHPCELGLDRTLCRFVEDDGQLQVDLLASEGADGIKVAFAEAGIDTSYPRLPTADLTDILQSDLPVYAHVASVVDAQDAYDAGARRLAHLPFEGLLTPADLDLDWRVLHSTLSANGGLVRTLDGEDFDGPSYRFLQAEVRENWQSVQESPRLWLDEGWHDAAIQWTEQARDNLGMAVQQQAPVVAGSDAGYYFVAHGIGLHQELEALVEAGMTPQEAIVAGSQSAAESLGWTDMGAFAAGYEASLLVLRGDPTDDITQTQDIAQILLRGQWTSPDALLTADIRLADAPEPCLADADCGNEWRCDLTDHQCQPACDTPNELSGNCGPDSWCMAQDGLSSTVGVCHVEASCDWIAQDCAPVSYGQACVPADLDTNVCRPAGPRQTLEFCSNTVSEFACEQGLLCSTTLNRCLQLCDITSPVCDNGTCQLQTADGAPWFGLCY